MPAKRLRQDPSNEEETPSKTLGAEDFAHELAVTRTKVADAMDSLQNILVTLDARTAVLEAKERRVSAMEKKTQKNRDKAASVVTLSLRGKVFRTYKDTLLSVKDSYFYSMISSEQFHSDPNEVHFIDRRYEGFERILEYLHSGELSVDGLSVYETQCVYDNLDYFGIPYSKWEYSSSEVINGLEAWSLFELPDKRLVGASSNDSIVVWNMETNSIDMTLEGHTSVVWRVIPLDDNRMCSCSNDASIKIWSISSGECELTLNGHTDDVFRVIKLNNGYICSCSTDFTIKVWDIESASCELTIETGDAVVSIVEVSDGRVCSGGANTFALRIWNLESGLCEMTLQGHSGASDAIISLSSSRICSASKDTTLKIWNIVTGACERTLKGHASTVYIVILMQDGRLCSGSEDGTIKLWNAGTGECEKTLDNHGLSVYKVAQLRDGRIVSADVGHPFSVKIWS